MNLKIPKNKFQIPIFRDNVNSVFIFGLENKMNFRNQN